jgi:ABC-2 type transport system permease protein
MPHFPVYLLTGIVLWNFFAEIASNSISAIVAQRDLIRKLNFPKYVIILSVAVSALINLALNLVVIGFFMAFNNVPLGWSLAWAPLYILEIFVLALSVGFILSAVYVRLRDVNYIWEVMAQALFYATPIIYPLSVVFNTWPAVAKLLLLNPIAQAIQDVRYVAITKETQTLTGVVHTWYLVAIPFVVVVLLAGIAFITFKKLSPKFAEEV